MRPIQIQNSRHSLKKNIYFVFGIIAVCVIVLVFHIFVKPREIQLDSSKYIEPISKNEDTIKIGNISRFEKQKRKISFSKITAKSVYAFNPETGKVYFSKNIYEKLPIASVTKLVTTLNAVNEYELFEEILISENLPKMDNPLGLKIGDQIQVSELLECALIASKNDCANALILGNKQYLSDMNSLATNLNMNSSHFSNPTGYINTDNYSTAYDLGLLSSAYIRNEDLIKITDETKAKITIFGKDKRSETVNTTNVMLMENKNIKGLKTGFTYAAGECLVLYYDFGGDNKMITVVLNSKDRFKDSRLLYNLIIEEYN